MNIETRKKGLRWFQSMDDAIQTGKVFYVFNPEIYTRDTLTCANQLIRACLQLWHFYGISNSKERQAVENLQRQYYNNRRRIYHLERYLNKQMECLRKMFERLKIDE